MNSQPISLIRGHDSVVPVHIELGYAPLDLSTATAATFTAKPGEFSTVVKITKTLGSGVTAGLLGLANISFSVADMAELDVSNSYTWSLTATVGGVASIVARGVLTAIGEPQQFVDEGVDQVARDLAASKASPEQVAASTAAHNADPAAHLNIVRRTLAGNLVLTAADLPQQKIIPDADRDVTLPAESTEQWMFEICHGGAAYVITLKRAGGTTVASLIPGSTVVVAWDGVAFGMC